MVAIIERYWFGGTGVSAGCAPAKMLVWRAAVAKDLKSRYQRIADTIVQLPRFDTFVFMHSAHTNQFDARARKLPRRTPWLTPVLLRRQSSEGIGKLPAGWGATCAMPSSATDTVRYGRRQVL
jgi:hypothetical protein